MYNYPFKLQRLINEISKFPGVGPKMAERIGLFLLKKEGSYIDSVINSLNESKDIIFCSKCFNVSEDETCGICSDGSRNKEIICVVESPEDIITVERTGKFSGYYHVLHGLINPLNNILPENLKIRELRDKAAAPENGIKEIILAINHTVEGDATALYITKVIREKSYAARITRLAKGLPTGSDIRYADEITLGQAIMERKDI